VLYRNFAVNFPIYLSRRNEIGSSLWTVVKHITQLCGRPPYLDEASTALKPTTAAVSPPIFYGIILNRIQVYIRFNIGVRDVNESIIKPRGARTREEERDKEKTRERDERERREREREEREREGGREGKRERESTRMMN